jgi:hypothetical protein
MIGVHRFLCTRWSGVRMTYKGRRNLRKHSQGLEDRRWALHSRYTRGDEADSAHNLGVNSNEFMREWRFIPSQSPEFAGLPRVHL